LRICHFCVCTDDRAANRSSGISRAKKEGIHGHSAQLET
jgi:hypothetical protein